MKNLNKKLSFSRGSELELNFQNDTENAYAYLCTEIVISADVQSSQSPQYYEQKQSWVLTSVIKGVLVEISCRYSCSAKKRRMSTGGMKIANSLTFNPAQPIAGQKVLEMEHIELCKLLFGKNRVNRKNLWKN